MRNRIEIILCSVKGNCSDSIYRKAKDIISTSEEISTVKQGRQIKSCIEMLEASKVCIKRVMRPCNCLSDSIVEKAKNLYKKANKDMEVFLSLLNENHIGGGMLHIDQGKIIGIYSKCYCGIPKGIKNMPASYCECSAGWYEKLFSNVFDREVTVDIVHTIIQGYDECTFEIY